MIKINKPLVDKVIMQAKQNKRKRQHYSFHKSSEDTIQRFINAFEPDTYVAPHKHENPNKREVFIILVGSALMVEFDDYGNVWDYIVLSREKGNFAVEVQAGVWHTLISLEPGTILYEIKDGPYNQDTDKTFADWAPSPSSADGQQYINTILKNIEI